MGSYDPMLSAFTPTKYLGTSNSTICVTGYDQVAFIAASSSDLFNEFNSSVRIHFYLVDLVSLPWAGNRFIEFGDWTYYSVFESKFASTGN